MVWPVVTGMVRPVVSGVVWPVVSGVVWPVVSGMVWPGMCPGPERLARESRGRIAEVRSVAVATGSGGGGR
jgi:hypothetical protein